jgi:Zn finger protein HypA/HybF involved in hydrogenase expression
MDADEDFSEYDEVAEGFEIPLDYDTVPVRVECEECGFEGTVSIPRNSTTIPVSCPDCDSIMQSVDRKPSKPRRIVNKLTGF